MLEVDKKEADLLQKAISEWEKNALISPQQANDLQKTWRVREADWQAITLYIFIAAISCALMAFGSLVLDEKWIEVLRLKFSLNDGIIATLFAGLTVFLCLHGYRRQHRHPAYSLNRELFWLLPVLSIGVSVVYLGKSLAYLNGNYGAFWLLATACYGALAIVLSSRLLWSATLLCFIPAYVKLTYFITADKPYFWGMNLPCRMFLLAVIMLGVDLIFRNIKKYKRVEDITWVGSWLLLLLSGWLISIFGNSGTWDEWQHVRQVQLLWWVAAFTILCVITLLIGIKTQDSMVRDISVLFLLLDMYTRYFEYLWDRTHKGLFFAILAVSFWWIGKLLERRMRKRNSAGEGETSPTELKN
ncbi:hypothetical protein SAMN05428988_5807 [Chitinophaga sp. YR573]|uniref:hypothetical protein n=1 Tax=Chitinophaga sp. YR573 TaxID=1881040 RepID=UPI0008BF9944|nr:hypothetical protein [Chitinophaga sp. YR573]SEW44591.1 hypothetical protein SAMN05428988_5807 [Chitinophaga sp. YR573]